jgi:hypothetical protein
MTKADLWPALPLRDWQDTYTTLHLWTQMAGKIRMALSPEMNHWWHVTLYVNSRGLTTSPIPHGGGAFEIQFDFQEHQLEVHTSEGETRLLALRPQSVASFYARLMEALRSLGIAVTINTRPQEMGNAIPFERDEEHGSYDADYARRHWRILLSSSLVMQEFRSRFLGKCSPVHFFWGSFDLACTRFCGRPAPPRRGAISGPAYSHEVISAGFWPGGGAVDGPAYYAYMVPAPAGLEKAAVRPAAAGWNQALSEFILMYDEVRNADSPPEALLDFLQSTYEAGARLGNWDCAALECERAGGQKAG